MTRLALAAVLVAALGPVAAAQPMPPAQPQPAPAPVLEMVPPVPPPPAVYQPNVYVPPSARPGPAIPYHKTGGVVVGAYGFYPYDTGDWLLGGSDGISRQSGSFTMVAPGVFPAPRRHPLFGHGKRR